MKINRNPYTHVQEEIERNVIIFIRRNQEKSRYIVIFAQLLAFAVALIHVTGLITLFIITLGEFNTLNSIILLITLLISPVISNWYWNMIRYTALLEEDIAD